MLSLKKLFFYPRKVKGSILIVTLWIAALLAIFATLTANRMLFQLSVSRRSKNDLVAKYLAQAGINQAINELEIDNEKTIDHLAKTWTDNPTIFKQQKMGDGQYSVSYDNTDVLPQEVFYGVIDEERKININTADNILLEVLLEIPKDIAENIRAWRGDNDVSESSKNYDDAGYTCKREPLANIEELLLVKGVTDATYQKAKNLVTVWGNGVNINTCSKDILRILVLTVERKLISSGQDIVESERENLIEKIIEFRQNKGIFTDTNIVSKLIGLSPQQINLSNGLYSYITVDSFFFRIHSAGLSNMVKYDIDAVYNLEKKTFVYWYEN